MKLLTKAEILEAILREFDLKNYEKEEFNILRQQCPFKGKTYYIKMALNKSVKFVFPARHFATKIQFTFVLQNICLNSNKTFIIET